MEQPVAERGWLMSAVSRLTQGHDARVSDYRLEPAQIVDASSKFNGLYRHSISLRPAFETCATMLRACRHAADPDRGGYQRDSGKPSVNA
jgi:hypothetical protein